MRTSVEIDNHLLRRARALATESGRSLSEITEDALRILLARAEARRSTPQLPTYGGGGVRPGVDLEDRDVLTVILGDDERP